MILIEWNVENIICAVCLLGFILSCISLKIIQKWHRRDPDFLIKQEEREREYRKKLQEEKELEEYTDAMYDDHDYDDSEYDN